MTLDLCSKCKHRAVEIPPMCHHPDIGIYLTSGDPEMILCRVARSSLSGFCGPSAALFEEKPGEPPLPRPRYLRLWGWIRGAWTC